MGDTSEPHLRVECYAGHRADEEPRRFFIGGRKVEVREVLESWLDPGHHYFKIRGDDGGIYILRRIPLPTAGS